MIPVTTDPKSLVLEKVKGLPPIPLVVHELLAVMRDQNCSADDITRVLSSDQALASKILRLVNSSFYGVPGGVATISRAVIILGHAALRSLATGLSIVGAADKAMPPDRRRAYWQHALFTAAGAETIAREIGLAEPEEAFVAGLLHDIGHLVLMVALPDRYVAALASGKLGDLELERSEIGLDHSRAGRYLLQHWKLPKHLLDVVRLHHVPDACEKGDNRMLAAVALADRLSTTRSFTIESRNMGDDVLRIAAAISLEPGRILALLPEIESRHVAAQAFLHVADIESTDDAPPAIPRRRIVVISNDPRRSSWIAGLAASRGHRIAGTAEFLAAVATTPVDKVIYDASTLTDAQRQRLAPILAGVADRIRVVDSGDAASRAGTSSYRALPLAFSDEDLED